MFFLLLRHVKVSRLQQHLKNNFIMKPTCFTLWPLSGLVHNTQLRSLLLESWCFSMYLGSGWSSARNPYSAKTGQRTGFMCGKFLIPDRLLIRGYWLNNSQINSNVGWKTEQAVAIRQGRPWPCWSMGEIFHRNAQISPCVLYKCHLP